MNVDDHRDSFCDDGYDYYGYDYFLLTRISLSLHFLSCIVL